MAIAQLPQRIPSAANERANADRRLQSSESWTRPFAAGSMIVGAVLVATGRLKAGLAVAATGAVVMLLEDPERIGTLWRNIPSYIDGGKRLLSQAEGFVGELETQRARLRTVVERAQRH